MKTTNFKKFETKTIKSIRLIAIHTAKKRCSDKLEKLILRVVELTLKEVGKIAYVLHRSIDNPDELMFYEIWKDEQSLQSHFKLPYIGTVLEKMKSILAKPVELKKYLEVR